ncbi:MAG: hypothetical protein Pyrs2KO_03630 [Pyruvatibacter sp.]
MLEETDTPAPTTRARNMAKRRGLILSHARATIAEKGFDALKLRDLARQAGVTVPTIYNLIGGKPEILALIIEELVERLQEVQRRVQTDDVELAFEAQIDKLAELFQSDENYYRAAFIAGDRSGLFEQSSQSGIFSRALQLPIDVCRDAVAAGLLFGNVSSEQMGRQIYGCYRLARQDWMNGYFDLEGFRRQSLTGVFLCLAADAKPAFRQRLMQRIENLKD